MKELGPRASRIAKQVALASIEETPSSEHFGEADTLGRLLNKLEAEEAQLTTAEGARSAAHAAMLPTAAVREATGAAGLSAGSSAPPPWKRDHCPTAIGWSALPKCIRWHTRKPDRTQFKST